jgi:hypothetical protein
MMLLQNLRIAWQYMRRPSLRLGSRIRKLNGIDDMNFNQLASFTRGAVRANQAWRRCLAIGVIVLFAATVARSTTVIPPNFESLVNQADYIVRAVVKSVSAEMRTDGPRRYVVTKVELDVRQVISGTPPPRLVLEMLGGKVGNEEMMVEGAPKFQVGDDDILFVHGNGRQLIPLVALMHGRYPIRRDADTGRLYVARSNGTPLFDHREVALPMGAASAVKASRPGTQALSPEDFASRIVSAINPISRTKLEN